MSTIQQTLRHSRQVQQKFKQFMQRKKQSDKSIQQTMRKIQQTQKTIQSTKNTITSIDTLYDTFQKRFSQAINAALKNVQKSVFLNIADPSWKQIQMKQKQFIQKLKKSKQVMILTGAGMSVASGIPTFRGANGFWDKTNPSINIAKQIKKQIKQSQKQQQIKQNNKKLQDEQYTPQQILTLKHFNQNQFQTWRWITNFYQIKQRSKPNKGHTSLHSIIQQMLNSYKKVLLVSQNIDNFHIQAKQAKKQKTIKYQYQICQIHGNIQKLRCDKCTQNKSRLITYPLKDYIKQISCKKYPKCPKCNHKLRPHIMFFDEFYSQIINKSQTVKQFQKQMDLLIVIGTALQTGLSRQIVQNALERKIQIIEINVQCQIKWLGSAWMKGKADQIIDKIKFQVWKNGL